jgi:hypothetical protein
LAAPLSEITAATLQTGEMSAKERFALFFSAKWDGQSMTLQVLNMDLLLTT